MHVTEDDGERGKLILRPDSRRAARSRRCRAQIVQNQASGSSSVKAEWNNGVRMEMSGNLTLDFDCVKESLNYLAPRQESSSTTCIRRHLGCRRPTGAAIREWCWSARPRPWRRPVARRAGVHGRAALQFRNRGYTRHETHSIRSQQTRSNCGPGEQTASAGS